jgi:hypothetical protein
MADIARHEFTNGLLALLDETFAGGGTVYLNKGAGLFQTLDAVTAETASHVPSPGAPTIAAHCAHLAYYVRANHDAIVGREQHLDWPATWQPQQVDDRGWEDLKSRVRLEYRVLVDTLERLESWSDQAVSDSLAIVAHTAYHLGVIRHVLRNFARSDQK